jgi:group II intron reverse transcriptase/maturase
MMRDELVSEPKPDGKPFAISKWLVWEAWRRVKANRGAAGVDEESIQAFEENLRGNLYKVWNRMSSGSYMPPPVRAVEIPKKGGRGSRMLGVPTVADRVAQTVAYLYLEPDVEPVFHPDSYGYRPRRSAHDALRTCRQRCWKYDWVLDLDLKSFFDSLDHALVLKTVAHHTDLRWILLYVERWLKAPLQLEDGTLTPRDRGSPQGSAISPVLANLFLHYALDMWLVREFPDVPFERYADDAILHCKTKAQAQLMRDAIIERLAQVGLELNLDKTRIVYCKDANRTGSHEHEQFTFLGYTFRPRRARNKTGGIFVSFLPAVSDDATKAIGQTIKRWRLHMWSGKALADLAREINQTVRGWFNYYGCFYPTELIQSLKRINDYLVRWAMRKYKRLRRRPGRAWKLLRAVFAREPGLFAHWALGARP